MEAVDSCAVVATDPVASSILLDMKGCCVNWLGLCCRRVYEHKYIYHTATELLEGFRRLDAR